MTPLPYSTFQQPQAPYQLMLQRQQSQDGIYTTMFIPGMNEVSQMVDYTVDNNENNSNNYNRQGAYTIHTPQEGSVPMTMQMTDTNNYYHQGTPTQYHDHPVPPPTQTFNVNMIDIQTQKIETKHFFAASFLFQNCIIFITFSH